MIERIPAGFKSEVIQNGNNLFDWSVERFLEIDSSIDCKCDIYEKIKDIYDTISSKASIYGLNTIKLELRCVPMMLCDIELIDYVNDGNVSLPYNIGDELSEDVCKYISNDMIFVSIRPNVRGFVFEKDGEEISLDFLTDEQMERMSFVEVFEDLSDSLKVSCVVDVSTFIDSLEGNGYEIKDYYSNKLKYNLFAYAVTTSDDNELYISFNNSIVKDSGHVKSIGGLN